MIKKILLLVLLSIITGHGASAQDKPLHIVTTTSQIGDLIQNIAPDENVEFLMGTGIDPHLYNPTRHDIEKLLNADIVFYNGMNLEGKMEGLLKKLKQQKPVYSISEALNKSSFIHQDGNHDPHIWMNVKNWINASTYVTAKIKEHKPDAKLFPAPYQKKLGTLHEATTRKIQSIPQTQRILITAHDAFGYLGKEYGLEVVGIQGISTESEAGLKAVTNIIDLIVSRKIPAVFVESSVGDHNIKAIIEGAAARGHKVKIGGELFSDAMGTIGTAEAHYIGMMNHNINTITKALGGTVDE